MVGSKEEAQRAVAACKYPPDGIRGFGPRLSMLDPEYFATANREIMVIALIETVEGVKNCDDILAVPGIDVGFIGVADLSLSMGRGLPIRWEGAYLEAFDKVAQAAKKHGKYAGLPAGLLGMASSGNVPGSPDWAIEHGFRMISIGDVDSFIFAGAKAALKGVKKT